jgi:hypothetical protein
MKSKIRFIKANREDVSGSGGRGYMRIPYRELLKAFGKPHDRTKEDEWRSGDNKTRAEWAFKTNKAKKPTVITIYDYKRDESLEELMVWNIGSKGNLDEVVLFFKRKLGEKGFRKWNVMIMEN